MVAGNFSVQRVAYYMICSSIIMLVLYVGQAFFIPLVFGVFFAFMLKPLRDTIERVLPYRVVAILLTFLFVFVVLGGIVSFFTLQVRDVVSSADNIIASLGKATDRVLSYYADIFGWTETETNSFLAENIKSIFEAPIEILTTGITTSGTIIANFVLVIIYTFFFLLYSTAFKRFALAQFTEESQLEGMQTLKEVQSVGSSYLGGMLTVMLVLAVLNSAGLYLIGVRYALLWGFLGAFLAIIPYIGTLIGGLLPVLYAISTTGTIWQPVAVVILYSVVQTIEGNFITPKVVGKSVKINALAAVIALIFGAFFWGFAGIIISIPLLAMIRIIMEHIQPLRPLALLLSDDLYDHSMRFIGEYNQSQYRLSSFLQRKTLTVRQAKSARKRAKPPHGSGDADTEVVADAKTQQGDGDTSGE